MRGKRNSYDNFAGRTAPAMTPLFETWRFPPALTLTVRKVSVPTLGRLFHWLAVRNLVGSRPGAMKITPWGTYQ